MWAFDQLGCDIGVGGDPRALKLLWLGVERWRDGLGQVPIKGPHGDDKPMRTVRGERYGIPNGKGGDGRWYVRTEDVSSLDESTMWDLFDQSVLSSSRVVVTSVDPAEYPPFVRSEQLPIPCDGEKQSLCGPLRDYLLSALTGEELYLTGRKVECMVEVPLAKLSLRPETDIFADNEQNREVKLDKEACNRCPYYVKSVITGRLLPLTVYIHSVNPRSPKKTESDGLDNAFLFTLEDPRFQVYFPPGKIENGVTFSTLDAVLAYIEGFVAESPVTDPTTWADIFIEVAPTDFLRAASSRMLVDLQMPQMSPMYCPVCRNHVMIPYQRVYTDPFDKSTWNHETGARIRQIASDTFQAHTFQDSESLLDLFSPKNADGERRRMILFCPSFCCASVYNKEDDVVPSGTSAQQETRKRVPSIGKLPPDKSGRLNVHPHWDEANSVTQKDGPVKADAVSVAKTVEGSAKKTVDGASVAKTQDGHKTQFPEDPAELCATVDLNILQRYDADAILEFHTEALTEALATQCGIAKLHIVLETQELEERIARRKPFAQSDDPTLEGEHYVPAQSEPGESENEEEACAAVDFTLCILSATCVKALYGDQAPVAVDGEASPVAQWGPTSILTRLKHDSDGGKLRGLLKTVRCGKVFRSVHLGASPLPLDTRLHCFVDCPHGCGERLPKLNKAKYKLHIDWRCPVAISRAS